MSKNLQLDQLDAKIEAYEPLRAPATPPTGWTKAIRQALGMSLQQLSSRLSMTKQSVQELERREKDETISIKSLKAAAKALDMELVYGFVPKDGSLHALVERKARELATRIVKQTSTTMRLEGQENSKERIQKAIDERTALLKNEMPKALWD